MANPDGDLKAITCENIDGRGLSIFQGAEGTKVTEDVESQCVYFFVMWAYL